MKFGKKSITLLGVGIVMILVICLTTLYNSNSETQSELLTQLDLIQPAIEKSSSQEVDQQILNIEDRQTEAESQMQAAKAQLQQPINAIVITDELLDIALITGVEIIKLSSPGISDKQLGGLTFTQLPVRLEVVGEVANLISFISEFTRAYPTGLVKSAQMSIPEEEEVAEPENPEEPEEPEEPENPEEPAEEEELELPSAKLEIQIYSCEVG
jgi:TolA-binding protein